MVEPISATAIAAETAEATATAIEVGTLARNALEATSVGINEARREISEKVLFEGFDKVNEAKRVEELSRFQNQFVETVNENTSFNKLKTLNKDIQAGGARSAKAIRELKKSSNVKGQLGEAWSTANKEGLGNVESQYYYNGGERKLDMLIDLEQNAKFETISTDRLGDIYMKPTYLSESQKAAVEVKNGGLDYLNKEVQNGHLLEQIKAGKNSAQKSFVEVNMDTFSEMLNNSEKAKSIINKINDAGGELTVGLPEYEKQMQYFMNIKEMIK